MSSVQLIVDNAMDQLT